MTVSFPLAGIFDRYPILTTSFFPRERQSSSRTGGGSSIVIDYRMPVWRASYVTALISEDDCIALEAELSALRGAALAFYGTDTRRPFPRLGPQSGVYGGAQISSVNLEENTVAFSALPTNIELSIGDRFHVNVGGKRRLYALAEAGGTTGFFGNTAPLQVVPQLFPTVAPGPVTFGRPSCEMRLIADSVTFNPSGNLLGTVSFEAEQI